MSCGVTIIIRGNGHGDTRSNPGRSVVYWPPTPPNMPFQRRRKGIFHWRGRAWLTVWERVKNPRYTHRLMHRKRVTCELYDSYFRLMTIKHAIPKTAEVTHSDGQLWGDIEWAIELLYNSVKTGSQLVWRPDSWRQVVVEKASSRQKGPSGPPIEFWRPDQLVTRCGRESHHPAESCPQPQASDWATLENEKDKTLMKEIFARPLSLCFRDSFSIYMYMFI